jgi:hypothetical protein
MKALLTACMLAIIAWGRLHADCDCSQLPDMNYVRRDTISTVAELIASVATGPTMPASVEIYLRAGQYVLTEPLLIDRPNVSIRSLSGHRGDVVISGKYPIDADGLLIKRSNFSIAHLTMQHIGGTAIVVRPNMTISDLRIYDVDITESKKQCLYITAPSDDNTVRNVVIRCCNFSYYTRPNIPSATPGVEIGRVEDVTIENCTFGGIRSLTSTPAPAVIVRGPSHLVRVERCKFLNCDMGVTIGNLGELRVDDGTVRMNFIKGDERSGTGISIQDARGAVVDHNTIFQSRGSDGSAIAIRGPASREVRVTDNFMDGGIVRSDDAPEVVTQGNLESASASDFVQPQQCNLHLTANSPAIDAATASIGEDIECQAIVGKGPDVGADEYISVSGVEEGMRMTGVEYDPAHNALIVSGSGSGGVDVTVVDVTGRVVASASNGGDGHIALPALPSGVYLLVARIGHGGMMSRKFVVEH